MKKTFALFLALTAFALVSAKAQEFNPVEPAQDTLAVAEPAPAVEEPLPLASEAPKVDKQIFNHVAAGIPIDFPILPDGIGIIEIATTCTPYLQFRLGYSLSLLDVMPAFTVNELSGIVSQVSPGTNIPTTIKINDEKSINIGDSKFDFGTNIGGLKFLMDVFPGKKTGFHFTFGAFFNPANLDNIFEVNADLASALKDAGFTPGKYNEVYFGFNDDDPKFRISPNKDGMLTVGIKAFPVRPYVGIGFGRAVRPDKRVCVTFDMGAFFWGTPVLVGYDYSIDPNGTAVGFSPERVSKSQDLQGLAQPLEILGKVPAYPVMKLNIFIRII